MVVVAAVVVRRCASSHPQTTKHLQNFKNIKSNYYLHGNLFSSCFGVFNAGKERKIRQAEFLRGRPFFYEFLNEMNFSTPFFYYYFSSREKKNKKEWNKPFISDLRAEFKRSQLETTRLEKEEEEEGKEIFIKRKEKIKETRLL